MDFRLVIDKNKKEEVVNIPKQLIEAANLDDANNFFKLKNIVLP